MAWKSKVRAALIFSFSFPSDDDSGNESSKAKCYAQCSLLSPAQISTKSSEKKTFEGHLIRRGVAECHIAYS